MSDEALTASAGESTSTVQSGGAAWRVWLMVGGTLLAVAALLSQVPSLSALWDTVREATWWWLALAVVFTLGNKVGYGFALMGSVSKRIPFVRSVEAMLAASFSNLALPGIGGTAVQVRYLQLQGVDLASAVAAGAVLANVANVVVQGGLFLIALGISSTDLDLSRVDVDNVVSILLNVVALVAVVGGVMFGVARFRHKVLPPVRRGLHTLAAALRSPRQIVLLVVGNVVAAAMAGACLWACAQAFGADVSFWPLLVVNLVVGTVASLIPIPGGNTLVNAIGLSTALVALGVSETVAVAAVISQQMIASYLPALPGWFATNDMLRRGLL